MRVRTMVLCLLVVSVSFSTVFGPARSAAAESLTIGGYAAAASPDNDGVNIRSGPSRADDRIGAINQGDVVAVIDGPYYDKRGDPWYVIEYGDLTGYAFGDYLAPVDGGQTVVSTSSADQYSSWDVGSVPILMYHHVDYAGGTYSVTPEQLDAQCQWLAANGYTAITLTEFYNAAFAGALLPARPVVFTIDDGWASALTFADILSWYGFVGNYFIVTDSELTADQVAYLGQVGEIEDHTVDHPMLSYLGYNDQYAEIANNRWYLENVTGQAVQFLAYPYGDWNASAVQAAADAGIIGAFDAWGGPAVFGAFNSWHIPRILIDGGYDLDTFVSVIGG